MTDQELALVANLALQTAEEAKQLIPSLADRFSDDALNRILLEVCAWGSGLHAERWSHFARRSSSALVVVRRFKTTPSLNEEDAAEEAGSGISARTVAGTPTGGSPDARNLSDKGELWVRNPVYREVLTDKA